MDVGAPVGVCERKLEKEKDIEREMRESSY